MNTKKEIADAVAKFIASDLMEGVDDKRLKFTLCMAKKALVRNPEIVDGFFESPIVSGVVKEQGGEYDLDLLARTLKAVIAENEYYWITIPAIPMFAPQEQIKITAEDVDKILSYLKPPETEVR